MICKILTVISFGIMMVMSCHGFAQDFRIPTQVKGTGNAGLWLGGVVAQHDGTIVFNTEIWTGGLRFGRVMTAPHGPAWIRGTWQWDMNVVPLFVVSNLQTAYSAEIDPIASRWNFAHRGQSSPYLEMAGGLVFTNIKIPPGDTSRFNVVPKVGFGWQKFRNSERSIDVGIYAWHLSNAWTAPRNPSVNGIQFTVGYHWFRGNRRVASAAP